MNRPTPGMRSTSMLGDHSSPHPHPERQPLSVRVIALTSRQVGTNMYFGLIRFFIELYNFTRRLNLNRFWLRFRMVGSPNISGQIIIFFSFSVIRIPQNKHQVLIVLSNVLLLGQVQLKVLFLHNIERANKVTMNAVQNLLLNTTRQKKKRSSQMGIEQGLVAVSSSLRCAVATRR